MEFTISLQGHRLGCASKLCKLRFGGHMYQVRYSVSVEFIFVYSLLVRRS
jgi:hypothetical protein